MNKAVEEQARAFLLNANLSEHEIDSLAQIGYFTAPAAMRHHSNFEGGLIFHSIGVARLINQFHAFKNPASGYRVGMLHDVVKCLCYRQKKDGKGYSWVDCGYPGHGVASCQILADLCIQLSPEERAAITWHMGAFGMSEDEMKAYQAAVLRFPRQIILTHAADHLASVYETFSKSLSNEDDEEN